MDFVVAVPFPIVAGCVGSHHCGESVHVKVAAVVAAAVEISLVVALYDNSRQLDLLHYSHSSSLLVGRPFQAEVAEVAETTMQHLHFHSMFGGPEM